VAEKLRKTVEKLGIVFADSELGHVTVSIGIASVTPTPAGDSWQLISAADAALYRAKASGRNCAVALQVEALTTVA
jgi:diguanylate cyclase (GGDEF)-like protein